MSSLIPDHSMFYYGYKINAEPYNGYIDIDEGSGEISIEVPVGSYTLADLAVAVREALLAQGTLNYEVSVDRETRLFTISADANFDLLNNTGTHTGTSLMELLGFSLDADFMSASTYTGTVPSGTSYVPQFLLQSYIGPDDWKEKNQASVNVSANGAAVEAISFGIAKYIQFDLKYITNKTMDGMWIKNYSDGLQQCRDFMSFITDKNYFEFMPSENDTGTYYKVLCESTADYSDGIGFKLREQYDKGLPGIFETGVIKLRVIE